MTGIAQFEKVPFEEFYKSTIGILANTDDDCELKNCNDVIKKIYDNIQLPTRGTKASAGYDIKSPFNFTMRSNDESSVMLIPTGLRCRMDGNYFLNILPRSGSGFKYGIRLANTCGIIDSDYYNADNYGHIMVKLTYESILGDGKAFKVKAGDAFAQGIFIPYGITVDDNADGIRTGGFGSTDK